MILADDATLNPIPSGSLGQIQFTVPMATAPGTYVLDANLGSGAFADAGGNSVPATLNDGAVNVTAPAGQGFYASTPAPGGTLDFGAAEVGSAATPVDTLNVQNLSPDTDFDITGLTGPAVLAFPATPITVPFGGNVNVPITCTPSARGDNGGTFDVAHDSGAGASSPVTYNFACAGLSPNVAVSTTVINLNGVISGTNPTGSFDITNAQDGFTSDATNASLTEATPGAPITITNGLTDATISVNETDTVTVECSTASAGMFTDTITLEYDDPSTPGVDTIDVTVNCDISNAVPSFDSVPAAPGPLAFGTVTNGTTSAPIGIDVFNDGVGPSPASDLSISSVTSSDPQIAVTVVNSGPFVVGNPADGSDDIQVTCSPTGPGASNITATITVNHNGDDNPTTFNATCSGESDASFSSTPAPGGVLNLGVVPPASTTAPGTIDFSNGGAVDDLQVDCTVNDPDGAFSWVPDPISLTVGPGATESVEFQCTPPQPGPFQADVSCSITGQAGGTVVADYTVVCQGQPLIVPTMNRWGLMVLGLAVLLLAGFAGRRMLA
ncbi:MAG: hypothetical protein Kow0020_04430 [Wenzhouxiangellaceae bacterium]